VPDARFPATLPAASGVNLTALNASNLTSGTIPSARVAGAYTAITAIGNTSSAISIVAAGNVTVNAPSSGIPLTVNETAGSVALRLNRAGTTLDMYMGAGVATIDASTAATGVLSLATVSTERVRIAAAGNVLVNAPGAGLALDVAGTSRSDIHILRSNQSAPTADAFIFRPADNTLGLGTANTERVRISAAGNVTVLGNRPVTVNGVSGFTNIKADAGVWNNVYGFSGSSDANFGGFGASGSDNSLSNFYIGPSDAASFAKISSTGLQVTERLLVGCASTPNASVAGFGINVTDGSGDLSIVCSSGAGTGGDRQIAFFNGNGMVGSIVTSGSNTSYNTSSDYRLKNITGPVTGSGAFIDALKPCKGSWKADDSVFVGFLAHEFQEVSPVSVSGVKDETKVEQYEVTPAVVGVTAVEASEGVEAVTGIEAAPAVMGERTVPVMQGMQASSSEVMANIVAEIQSLRLRLVPLEVVVQEQQALIESLTNRLTALPKI